MTMKSRITAVAAVAAATALVLSGCGRSDTAGSQDGPAELTDGPATGTVTIWAQGTEGEALQEFVKPFEEANPDVTVEVTPVPWDSALNKYQTAVAGGTTPDIGMIGTDWMPGLVSSLQPTPDAIDTSDIFPYAVGTTEFDGVRHGVPWYVETRLIFHRTDLMEEAGFDEFPADWDGFKELAEAYKANGAEYAVALPAGGWNGFLGNLPFMWSNGADIVSEDGSEWTFDTPEIVEGLEYVKGFFDEGLADANPDTENSSNAANFVDGSVPMFLSGPWDVPGIADAGGAGFEDKFDVAPIPASPDGTSTSFAAGANLVVFDSAENPDAAWKLIQWLTQPEVQVEWFQTVNALPSQQSAWDDPVLSEDPKVAAFGDQLESVKTAPNFSNWSEVSAAADTYVEQIMRGGKDPAEAMAELQAEADSMGTGE